MDDVSVRKKFNKVSAAGLGIAKNGKMQFPFKYLAEQAQTGKLGDDLNAYGQKRPQIGDFCASALPSGILSAGTVGRIVSEDPRPRFHDGSYTVQFMDGRLENTWRYATGYLTEAQAKEVRDYYVVTEKRPERIKHDFWPDAGAKI